MKRLSVSFFLITLALNMIMYSSALSQTLSPSAIYSDGPVDGKMIDAEFLYGDSNYHAIVRASDGNVYYVICSHNTKSGAHMFRYDPRTGEVVNLSDLTAEVGEDSLSVTGGANQVFVFVQNKV